MLIQVIPSNVDYHIHTRRRTHVCFWYQLSTLREYMSILLCRIIDLLLLFFFYSYRIHRWSCVLCILFRNFSTHRRIVLHQKTTMTVKKKKQTKTTKWLWYWHACDYENWTICQPLIFKLQITRQIESNRNLWHSIHMWSVCVNSYKSKQTNTHTHIHYVNRNYR